MAFEFGMRRGQIWDDAKALDNFIQGFPFHTTSKKERDFENSFASGLINNRNIFNSQIMSQIDVNTSVTSVYCFGKKHRPDMTLGDNGIAIEMKYITYGGLRDAIGQGHIYRISYKFVFLILIISKERKVIYRDLMEEKEKNLKDILYKIANDMNIFTYIAPAFKIDPGMKKCIEFGPSSLEQE